MSRIKWTEEKVLDVVKLCRVAGAKAAQAKLAELQGQGDKWSVVDGNGREVGRMLDVCGFANLRISARGKFFQLAKKLSGVDRSYSDTNPFEVVKPVKNYRFFCTNRYGGGGMFNVYDATNRQEMSINVAACKAMKDVLDRHGIESHVESRID